MWVFRGYFFKGKIMDSEGRVIALKWRPQRFDEVVGQEHITKVLKNSIKSGKISHAYLFTGIRGVGKTSTARILAKALNCRTNGPTPDPCNECDACQEIQYGKSVDVIEIDAASNRGINEIRELRENVKFKPARERYRVYIIDEVHMLTTEAFNALLKTLEEPPEYVVFVLATTEVHKLPKTVISRCQQFDFKSIPYHLMLKRLSEICQKEDFKISEKSLTSVVKKSGGSMRDAESTLQKLISFGENSISDEDVLAILGMIDFNQIVELFESLQKENSTDKVIKILSDIYNSGHDIINFYRDFSIFLRDILTFKTTKDKTLLITSSPDEIQKIVDISEKVDVFTILRYLDILFSYEEKLKNTSFPRFMAELIFAKISLLNKILPPDELLKKLLEVKSLTGKIVDNKEEVTNTIENNKEKQNFQKASHLDEFLNLLKDEMADLYAFLPEKEDIQLKDNKLFLNYKNPNSIKMKMLKINMDRVIDFYMKKFGKELRINFGGIKQKNEGKKQNNNIESSDMNSTARVIIDNISGNWKFYKNGEN